MQEKLRSDDPSTVWLTLDGWSAETTSYIGLEICMIEIQTNSHLILLCSVYIANWRRVKLVLGCSPFEMRHTGELMAGFVEDVCDSWGIRRKVTA